MSSHNVLELIGYVASALVAISLMMSSILRLRVINLIGAAAFAAYGIAIGAYPVVALNGFLVAVNAYHLFRMVRVKEYFHLLESEPNSQYLKYFLAFHGDEIRRIVPDFRHAPVEQSVALFILRDCIPAGVFLGTTIEAGILRVDLDFVIPRYRDLRAGKFLFVENARYFREHGISEILVKPRTRDFNDYLLAMGFDSTDPTLANAPYRLRISETR